MWLENAADTQKVRSKTGKPLNRISMLKKMCLDAEEKKKMGMDGHENIKSLK